MTQRLPVVKSRKSHAPHVKQDRGSYFMSPSSFADSAPSPHRVCHLIWVVNMLTSSFTVFPLLKGQDCLVSQDGNLVR